MIFKNKTGTSPYIFLLAYLLIWLILFEFIIPASNVLPKPSIVFQSFGALWSDYNLLTNFLSTVSSIYLPLIIAYFLVMIISEFLFNRKSFFAAFISSIHWFGKYLPGLLIAFIIIYWFPDSNYIESVFVFFTALSSMIIFYQLEIENVEQEYIDSALSLGISKSNLNRKVLWKSVQPKLFSHIFEMHLYIWSMIIAFEFIKGGFGLGVVLKNALLYRDLSALFSIFIITGVTIFIGQTIIRFLKKKFAFWS